ncbi:MAG: dockerin type I domain-containing protein [Patescibacteria group bacterium]|nr:dockerin type I domain-containing protein [Patescibacteria group bacterium]
MHRLVLSPFLWITLFVALATGAMFAQDGILSTTGGTGNVGYDGDGGHVSAATFSTVVAIAQSPVDGSTYLVDGEAHTIRRVDADGIITTICGVPACDGGSGDDGPATEAMLNAPQDLAVDLQGNVYVADSVNHVVRKIDAAMGIITRYAGSRTGSFNGLSGLAVDIDLNNPSGIAVDADGNLYIADTGNCLIRKVDTSGMLTTIAGMFEPDGSSRGDGGQATEAMLNQPCAVTVAADGTYFIAEYAGLRVRRVGVDGIITTIAGTGTAGYAGDGGPATDAQLNFVGYFSSKIGVDSAGNLFIADSGNNVIRRVDTSGTIKTLAGNGNEGYGGDGLWAYKGQLALPYGLATLPSGDVAIADTFNGRIREVQQNFGATAGTNIPVAIGNEATVTFSKVQATGEVTVNVRDAMEPAVVGDLQMGSEYVDINTSATFIGKILVKLPYDDLDPSDPPDELASWDLAQKVLHYTNRGWQDATKEVLPDTNEIVAEVTSLSPFVVVTAWPGFDPAIFRRGDANSDGEDDVSDAVRILIYLFVVPSAPISCAKAADVNDDGRVSVTDAITLLLWMFGRGGTPPYPGPFDVGVDMTRDALDCVSYP